MDIAQNLRSVDLFQGLTQEQLLELASITGIRKCNRGELIFSEGDPGIGFYVVASGRVKIFKLSMDGKEQILHIFSQGEPFAEAAVFAGSSFPAHAEAMEKSELFFFPRSNFRELIQRNPSLAMNMMAALSMRLKKFAALIENLSLKEVPGRLAAHLLFLSANADNSETINLDINKSQLASLLGTIPETLSRILSKMAKQGIIESKGPQLHILDLEALDDLASGDRRL